MNIIKSYKKNRILLIKKSVEEEEVEGVKKEKGEKEDIMKIVMKRKVEKEKVFRRKKEDLDYQNWKPCWLFPQ